MREVTKKIFDPNEASSDTHEIFFVFIPRVINYTARLNRSLGYNSSYQNKTTLWYNWGGEKRTYRWIRTSKQKLWASVWKTVERNCKNKWWFRDRIYHTASLSRKKSWKKATTREPECRNYKNWSVKNERWNRIRQPKSFQVLFSWKLQARVFIY